VPAAPVLLCFACFNIPLALPRNRDKLFKGGISLLFKEKILLKSQRASLSYGNASLFSAEILHCVQNDVLFYSAVSLFYGKIGLRYQCAALSYGIASLFSAGASLLYGNISFR